MSVSPVEEDNSNVGGDDRDQGVEREVGDEWDNMMRPFDQDEEEQRGKGEQKEKEEEPASDEAARVKMISPGYHPTSREIAEHMVNHLPYRAWCKHCVKGKAKGLPHRGHDKEGRKEEEIPVVSFDYMFMHDDQKEGEERGMPILLAKDRRSKVIRARVIPQKGSIGMESRLRQG